MTLSFSEALENIKSGNPVLRQGWNGKGMSIFLKKGSRPIDMCESHEYFGVPADLFEKGDAGTVVRMPCVCMKAANGEIVEGWLASQTDMLAKDWISG